jgi:glycosyltransferase involved in cell wall biosynthesis
MPPHEPCMGVAMIAAEGTGDTCWSGVAAPRPRHIVVVTSIHPDFDARIWKHSRSLARAGMRVTLVSPWPVVTDGCSNLVQKSFARVTRRWTRPWLVPWRVGRTMRALLPEADLVHFHDIDLLPAMTLVARRLPVIYDMHENYPDEMLVREWIPKLARRPLAFMVRLGQRILARKVGNCVLVVDSQIADLDPEGVRWLIVRNYASLDLLQSVADDHVNRPATVVFTGGQHQTNGSGLMLDVAEILARELPALQWLATDRFASDDYRRWFESEILRRGLGDCFKLVPFVPSDQIMRILNRGTIGISPNLRTPNQEKAIPTKLFEYMAAGLPIVTSDLPNQKRIIEDSQGGLLARPEEPASFAVAIRRLVEDPALARRLGASGQRAFRERFSWESQMPALLGFYERVFAAKGIHADDR